MGITGDCTRHLLWRLDAGELDGCASPALRAVVVQIGCNNVCWGGEADVDVVAHKIANVAAAVAARLPDVAVLVTPLLPARGQTTLRAAINARLASVLASRPRATYLARCDVFPWDDASPAFDALFPDGMHLSPAGYDAWAAALAPELAAL